MKVVPHTFAPRDLVGGHVVLDLVNTVTARNAEPLDWLTDYARLLDWATLTVAFDRGELAELQRASRANPAAAAGALEGVRELRETVHRIVSAIVRGEPAPAADVAALEAFWKDAARRAQLVESNGLVRIEPDAKASSLRYVQHKLTLLALELLGDLPVTRTRVCAGSRCGWIFFDSSKGGRRRWCDMATCGNVAKSRRYHARKRAQRQH